MTDRNTSFARQLERTGRLPDSQARHARSETSRHEFERMRRGDANIAAHKRDSEMIKRQQPKPALKPSPALGAAVDAQAFSEVRRKDHTAAKRAFIQMRKTQAAQNAITLTQSYNQTKGHDHGR